MSGRLLYVFLVSILDAALISWLALRWYGHAVGRLMSQRSEATVPGTPGHGAAHAQEAGQAAVTAIADNRHAVPFAVIERPDVSPSSAHAPIPPHDRRRLTAAYCAGAAAFSLVTTALQLSGDAATLPLVAWFIQWWVNAWPIVPTLAAILVLDRRAIFRLTVSYIAAGAILQAAITVAGQATRGALDSAPLTNAFYFVQSLALTAAPLLPLLLLSGWRRVRAVTPLALAGTLLFGFASLLMTEALVQAFDVDLFRRLFLALPGSGMQGRDATFLLAALPVGWLAWRALTMIARRYAAKRFSDVQLVVDCCWFIVTCFGIASSAAQRGLFGIGATLAALVAYRATVALVLRGWPAAPAAPRRLLLLRVFGYQARTEALFDRVAQQWRFHGPVQLIAGVDLATRTADAGDMLAFVGGRLPERYVSTPAAVASTLAALDNGRDPDGRFRVNEVYCHDDTWRPVLIGLLGASDIVLMDLRNFGGTRAGCIFEIEQLMQRAPSTRVVLICGPATDMELLARLLGSAWAAAAPDAHNRGRGEVAVVRVDAGSSREIAAVTQRLLAGGPSPLVFSPVAAPVS